MNAPQPVFTSITRPSRPGGELLRQDRGGDQRDQLHRAGHVADGVEPAVGGREVVGLADDGAADLARRRGGTGRCRDRSGSPEWRRACRACRRCGRARGRRSSARSRRRPRRAGASIRLTLSPTPPVECLSSTGPRSFSSSQRSTMPDAIRPRVNATRSGVVMSRKNTAIANAATWPSVSEPSAMPRVTNAISSAESASPSRFRRMISCGSMVSCYNSARKRVEQRG